MRKVTMVGMAELVDAPDCESGNCKFDSCYPPHINDCYVREILCSNLWEATVEGLVYKNKQAVGFQKKANSYVFVKYKRSDILVHRLVCAKFFGTDTLFKKPMTVNHKNGIKYDNRLENLEVVPHSENLLHALRTGLRSNPPVHYGNQFGTKHDEDTVSAILKYRNAGLGYRDIGKKLGLGHTTVFYIIRRNCKD